MVKVYLINHNLTSNEFYQYLQGFFRLILVSKGNLGGICFCKNRSRRDQRWVARGGGDEFRPVRDEITSRNINILPILRAYGTRMFDQVIQPTGIIVINHKVY